jgi:hypothetical protein
MKTYKNEMKAAKEEMADVIKKLHLRYQLFMGEKKQVYDNIVHNQFETNVTHNITMMWKMKQLAFLRDPTTKKVEGQAEHMDEMDPADNKDQSIIYLWRKVPEEVEVTRPRGLSLASINHCIRQHSVQVGGCGRAKIQRTYMRNHAPFPADLSMQVKSFANVFIGMNKKNLPLLPCYKDNPPLYENDDNVPVGRVALSNMELCSILLESMVPKEVQGRFNELKPSDLLLFSLLELARELKPTVKNAIIDECKKRNNNNNSGSTKNNTNASNVSNVSNVSNANKSNKSGNRNNQSNQTPTK